ncbi:MAG TPA: hypothetical protein VFJ82_01120 [Longimicrobium sp.]|nr:hypothetical protein [Longimicrobium sp.]
MITADKVRVYFKYDGDSDYLQRGGPTRDRTVLERGDWHTLDQLRMALANLKAGQVSDELAERTRADLARLTDGPETARMLMDLA